MLLVCRLVIPLCLDCHITHQKLTKLRAATSWLLACSEQAIVWHCLQGDYPLTELLGFSCLSQRVNVTESG